MMSGRYFKMGLSAKLGLCLVLVTAGVGILSPGALAQPVSGAINGNQLVSVAVDNTSGGSIALVKTRDPVGYRYTVYDSYDPIRVVLDFPGMDVSSVSDQVVGDDPLVKEIKVSSFELTSGRLGRVELVLTKSSEYEIVIADNEFRVVFADKSGDKSASAEAPGVVAEGAAVEAVDKSTAVPDQSSSDTGNFASADAVEPTVPVETLSTDEDVADQAGNSAKNPARKVEQVTLGEGQAVFSADGLVEKYRHFPLAGPPRLVLDLYGVQPGFKERAFAGTPGFKDVRVGVYKDKTRFVLDAEGKTVPDYTVVQDGSRILLSWGEKQVKAEKPAVIAAKAEKASVMADVKKSVVVQNLDFSAEDGKSVFTIELSGRADYSQPSEKNGMVRFGIDNAVISRAQRRTIDTFAFPTAIKQITPYTVLEKGVQQVRFAVELKGGVPYTLQRTGDNLQLVVEDGAYAEAEPPAEERQEVLLSAPVVVDQAMTKWVAAEPGSVPSTEVRGSVVVPSEQRPVVVLSPGTEDGVYTGQKITLQFDNADIRQILQLIGEVSDLNIIASDEVKGTITLRLIDVPWDQALALILEIKGLGMLRDGNVVRILPVEKIRAMDEAKLTAARTKEKLENLTTEVIEVSYTALENVVVPAKELLTDRGKITADNRNKQIIVTDVASVISEVRNLVRILDTPERQVLIEARIVEASSSFGRDLGVNWRVNNDNAAGNLPSNSADFSGGGGFLLTPSIAGAGLAGDITFGQIGIDSTVLDLRISALETSGNGKVISRPRVTTLNGEEATISQGTQIPYQSVSDKGTTTEFKSAELSLKVTPVINPDGSVILEIDASNSSIGSTVATGAGSAPAIDTKNAKTKLLVMDGETTVIGGIFVESENFGEAGIPFLRKIPILGRLFRSNSQSSTRSELLIFITPRIVN
jgi:type IV pilus assembly protein PilQ